MLIELFVIGIRIKIREGNSIEYKIVGQFKYTIRIYTNIILYRKYI